MGHPNHHQSNATTDGTISQRVNSPRFSGPMTRRAQSFKRNNNNNNNNNNTSQNNTTQYEIDLPVNSPRSELAVNSVSADGFDSNVEKKQPHHHNLTQRVHTKKHDGSISVDLILGGKKKLGQWMFFVFCGVCLFLGVFKICANGWFGSVVQRVGSDQDSFYYMYTGMNRMDKQSHANGLMEHGNEAGSEGLDVERTLKTVTSGFVGTKDNMSDDSVIWLKPNSENFTQCIERPKGHQHIDANTNGFLLINANGGLNQMRFGSADL